MYIMMYYIIFQKKLSICFGGLRNCCTFAPANEKSGPWLGGFEVSGAQFFDIIP